MVASVSGEIDVTEDSSTLLGYVYSRWREKKDRANRRKLRASRRKTENEEQKLRVAYILKTERLR